MTGFNFEPLKKSVPDTPEALFKSLKKAGINHPWSQQADCWREYQSKHLQTPNVALELPTGSGKTLIGLVLAEWRRRKFSEKVLYLCPNNQLADQVGAHAQAYGIKGAVMKRDQWDELPSYLASNVIAISSYKSLFNSNSKFRNPDLIILDDAHSAEDSVASLWSVRINRNKDKSIYLAITNLFKSEIHDAAYYILDDDTHGDDRYRTYSLAQPFLFAKKEAVFSILDSNAADADWRYEWLQIKDKLHACQLFFCWNEILIRPVIPPTGTHLPFANANQRIYMSATLGAGGELERITGVDNIQRVPIGEGVENSGRRLFLFTNQSPDATEILLADAIKKYRRALALVPSRAEAEPLRQVLEKQNIRILDGANPAKALTQFENENQVALILANRYDGIDLPGEKCRLMFLAGKPVGENLLERFLLSYLNATTVLRDRLRTRFVQGIGRCCRGDGDYAAIIIIGKALHEFCVDSAVVSGLSPILQAEIAFGLNQGEDKSSQALLDFIGQMMQQTAQWEQADTYIVEQSKLLERSEDQASALLFSVVKKEVRYQYELIKKNYLKSYELALDVASALAGNRKLIGYRAWWLYLGASALWLHRTETGSSEHSNKVFELLDEASNCTKGVSWFAEIRHDLSNQVNAPSKQIDLLDKIQCEEATLKLKKLGLYDKTFESRMAELLSNIQNDAATKFVEGLYQLGTFIGFSAHNFSSESGAPDAIWTIGSRFFVTIEAKSEENPNGGISLDTVRQSLAQDSWTFKRLSLLRATTEGIRIIVSPRKLIAVDAKTLLLDGHKNSLFYRPLSDVRDLTFRLVNALRQTRARSCHNDEESALFLHEQFDRDKLLMAELKKWLKEIPLESLSSPEPRLTK
jgi:hypothetical protein